ncbi:MAG TPA: mechanosensitive ion channel domain-containing protein [Sphingomonadales bacterium]|nr:mechanosensitive ion channel domain-containing protein [Sphingomonadales bacterium]
MEQIREMAGEAWRWLTTVALSPDNLLQAAVLGVLAVLAWWAAKGARAGLAKLPQKSQVLMWVEEFLAPVLYPLVFLALALIAAWAAARLGKPADVFAIAQSLLLAWVVIRLLANFIRNRALARIFVILIWAVAALSVFGLLEAVIAGLEAASIRFGEARVSAYDVIWGILTLIFFVWAAIFVSNLFEAQLRAFREISPSVRVLLVKLVKFFLVFIAFLAAFNAVGFDLTVLAVFGGALGVGLGFGLQKAVSNFLSGIILLIDRSIKPGDVIQIQNTFGWINKLAARYTSVITRDGTEFLIPNEDMITQQVINWSHTDRAVRLKIPVSVAYATDLHQARALMNEAAAEHERVLEAPQPVSHVMRFGDNGVDLELRMWINDPENGVTNVSSDVMLKIWDKFHAAGIEFPYPQRVIHYAKGAPPAPEKKS